MRMKPFLLLLAALGSGPAAAAEEIRMIGQSVMFSQKSILSNVLESRDHRQLSRAIRSVGLVKPLMQRGAITVLAPDDAAFAALPEAYLKRLFERVNRDQMARVLACHIITDAGFAGRRMSELVADGQALIIPTLGGCPLRVENRNGRILVTGLDGAEAEITTLDVAQANGMIEIIDRVLPSSH